MKEVKIELFNVSDEEYKLIEISGKNGDKIKAGEALFCLESSKANIEIEAETDGFLHLNPNLKLDQNYKVGFILAYLSDSLNEIPVFENGQDTKNDKNEIAEDGNLNLLADFLKNNKVTDKATKLLKGADIDLRQFKTGSLVTEREVLAVIAEQTEIAFNHNYYNHVKRIALIGAGTGAIQVIDLVKSLNNMEVVCIYDDTLEKQEKSVWNVPVKGKVIYDDIQADFKTGLFDSVVIAVSTSIPFRKKAFVELTRRGVEFINLIHPSVVLGNNVSIGKGNIIFALTHIGPFTTIGDNCFITAKCSIEHHNKVGNHCTFGPGVMTSGLVIIEDEVKFGTGIFIEPKVQIGKNAIISSGSIINFMVPESSIVKMRETVKPTVVKKD